MEGLGAPGGATSKRGVVLEFDGETAGAAVVAELRERVGICVWVGLRERPAMSEDKAPAWDGRGWTGCGSGSIRAAITARSCLA